MTIEGAQTTLRDTITDAFDATVRPDAPGEAVQQTPAPERSDVKADDRPRDESGRFVEGKQEKPQAKQAPVQAKAVPGTLAPAQQVAPQVEKPKYPSTWKKGLEQHFEKLPAEVIAEIARREADYAKGVSTYKHEWDNAKPLIDAMAPFMPLLQQHNIPPAQWISRLGAAHQQLSLGTPEQKVQMFARLAQDYGVPLNGLVVQGQDGKFYINPQLANAQQQPAQQQFSPQDIAAQVEKTIEQRMTERESNSAIAAFAADSEKHPHFEEVRDTMAGLLQAGLAEGLEDAYDAALRHPRHADLYKGLQEQQRQADEQRQAEERRRATEAARRKAVSPRSATPTSPAGAASGKKSLRDTISEAVEENVASRV